jgi:hypothetical protein
MLRLFIVIVKCRYLAKIFILKKIQVSSVYHNYLGPLPIIASLQQSVFSWQMVHIQDMGLQKKAGHEDLAYLFDN